MKKDKHIDSKTDRQSQINTNRYRQTDQKTDRQFKDLTVSELISLSFQQLTNTDVITIIIKAISSSL